MSKQVTKVYGNISIVRDFPKPSIILHLQDLATVGEENVELSSPLEAMAMAQDRKVTKIHFYGPGLPRRSVDVEKAERHLKRLFAS